MSFQISLTNISNLLTNISKRKKKKTNLPTHFRKNLSVDPLSGLRLCDEFSNPFWRNAPLSGLRLCDEFSNPFSKMFFFLGCASVTNFLTPISKMFLFQGCASVTNFLTLLAKCPSFRAAPL